LIQRRGIGNTQPVLLTYILATFTVISLVLTLWQWLVASTFDFNKRSANPAYFPALTILKPVKGADAHSRECLRSWFLQEYRAPVQILFGVASAEDTACPLIRELIAAFPQIKAELVVCPENHGNNAKVSTLIQLERHATGEVVMISDADVFAPAETAAQVVQPLADAGVGLVNCFYRLTNTENFGMRWEAFAINSDFWGQVLQAQSLKPVDFAMGAVMALRKGTLAEIGGFKSLEDYLADDYQLGNRVAKSGKSIVISSIIVECRSATQAWQDVWRHQVRWARTIRVCQPIPYFFSKLSNATLWPVVWMTFIPGPRSLLFGGLCLGVRMAEAFYCEQKMAGKARLSSLPMALVKDLLQIAIWAMAFIGNAITWRGRQFRVLRDGKLLPLR